MADEPPVIVGIAPVAEAVDPEPVMITEVDCTLVPDFASAVVGALPEDESEFDAVPVFDAVFAEFESVDAAAAALERLGRTDESAAEAVMASNETARAVASSGVLRDSLMMSVITADSLK